MNKIAKRMKKHAEAVNSNKDFFKKNKSSRILIYGIGNPSRQDDALGVLFAEMLKEWADSRGIGNITVDSNYQLNIEDALDISGKDVVIFADASVEEPDSFSFRRIKPSKSIEMSTHSMKPESVLALCEELFGSRPDAYLLTIKGYSWEVSVPMTEKACEHLKEALEHVEKLLG